MKPKYSTENVTPKTAEGWLAKSNGNRPFNRIHMLLLARQMTAGEWKETGDPIRFDTNGVLIDGHHRLSAIVESGVTVRMLLMLNADPGAVNVIDTTTRPRSASDIFAMRGLSHTRELAAGIKLINEFSRNGIFGTVNFANKKLTQGEYDTYLETFPQLIRWAQYASINWQSVLSKKMICGFGLILELSESQPGQAIEFMEQVLKGEYIGIGDPAHTLRKKLIMMRDRPEYRPRAKDIARYLIQAWNAFVQGRKIQRLGKVSDFPKVAGFDPSVLPYYGRPQQK